MKKKLSSTTNHINLCGIPVQLPSLTEEYFKTIIRYCLLNKELPTKAKELHIHLQKKDSKAELNTLLQTFIDIFPPELLVSYSQNESHLCLSGKLSIEKNYAVFNKPSFE
ncbi:hypothetical protein DID76_04340 [Candidatus Marinamargulisbacteria bacterium SCGC AG-414-C22]|nr:hypothetical protein DID76_04340 [Candidatus Marinamargulisbacteria bacterium SCGC AG-414-C22]